MREYGHLARRSDKRRSVAWVHLWLAAVLACGLPSHARALQTAAGEPQDSEAASEDDAITVTGVREKEIRKAIDTYTRKLTDLDPTGPVARYQPGFYCPVVLGLDDSTNERIADRMRIVAKAAGVKPASKGCVASALVFIVDDKASFLTEFKKAHPSYFRDPRGALWSPPREAGPSIAWQLLQEMDPDGKPLGRVDLGTKSVRVASSTQGGSHLRSMISLAVAASVVIIERKALEGLVINQIADYALMRGLSDGNPRDMKGVAQFSILGVLDTPMNDSAHASLTEWDFAYLQGRYAGDPRSFGTRQGATIRATIRNKVIEQPGGE